jgi:hypothetical protein
VYNCEVSWFSENKPSKAERVKSHCGRVLRSEETPPCLPVCPTESACQSEPVCSLSVRLSYGIYLKKGNLSIYPVESVCQLKIAYLCNKPSSLNLFAELAWCLFLSLFVFSFAICLCSYLKKFKIKKNLKSDNNWWLF